MPKFVLIIGPQAVGKMTVGQELEKLTRYKLFYNHMTIEMVRKIFDYNKDSFRRMNQIIRYEVFKEFAKSKEKGIIFTGCFDFENDFQKEKEEVNKWMELFDETYVIELEADLEERLKRNKTENRLRHKESKRNLEWSEQDLMDSMKKHRLNSYEGEGEKIFKNYMKINNTNIPAKEAAKMIEERFKLNKEERRDWIKLRKRYATNPNDMKIVKEGNLKIKKFNNADFKGDIALIEFNKMYEPYVIEGTNSYMANDNYKWLEFYDYDKKYRLTAMYNEKEEIVEWYFDIARIIGKDKEGPYEDDLYLDIVVTPSGDIILLDEDELKEAFKRKEMTKEEYDEAYKIANDLVEKIKNNKDKLQEYTDKYLREMLN